MNEVSRVQISARRHTRGWWRGCHRRATWRKGIFRAYWVGGAICVLGQLINDLFSYGLKWGMQSASTATSICLIFIASLLTGLGVYDKIGKYAGAGSIVPITGFANSVVSPAMEFRREGLVMGVGAKMFTLAGPVLVYGIGSSVLVGLVALPGCWAWADKGILPRGAHRIKAGGGMRMCGRFRQMAGVLLVLSGVLIVFLCLPMEFFLIALGVALAAAGLLLLR